MRVSRIMEVDPVTVRDDAVVSEAARLLDEHRVRHLPVLAAEALVGVLSDRDLLEPGPALVPRIDDEGELEPLRVRDVMCPRPVTAPPEETVGRAAATLAEWGIGCLPVARGSLLVGLLTDTDVLELFVDESRYGALGAANPPVSACMTKEPRAARVDTRLGDAVEWMVAGDFRHLPIQDAGGRLVGIVSDRDLRRAAGRGLPPGTHVSELVVGRTSTAGAREPLSRAAWRMAHEHIGALPVVEGDDRLLGIVTVTDVLVHCARVLDG